MVSGGWVKRTIKELRSALGLQEWDLVVRAVPHDEVEEDKTGQIHPDRAKLEAKVRIAMDQSDKAVGATCVHEMLHLRLNDLAAVFDDAVMGLCDEARGMALRHWADVEERTVIALTRWSTGRAKSDG